MLLLYKGCINSRLDLLGVMFLLHLSPHSGQFCSHPVCEGEGAGEITPEATQHGYTRQRKTFSSFLTLGNP